MTRRTLLLVDDTKTIRAMERALLGPAYDYLEAEDGSQALAMIATKRPDLILMDVMMPVLDGLSTLHKLKESPDTSGIPVIMVTSEHEASMRERAKLLGCAGFVIKPIRWEVLLDQVKKALPK